MKELKQNNIGFVLVAGGLGERLGYSGIKIALPTQSTSFSSEGEHDLTYIELYCKQILAIQTRYCNNNDNNNDNDNDNNRINRRYLPLVIMVSDDTEKKTRELLNYNNNYGLNEITIVKQEKVGSLG
jgi:UDP-sugar pyrophosphorylase